MSWDPSSSVSESEKSVSEGSDVDETRFLGELAISFSDDSDSLAEMGETGVRFDDPPGAAAGGATRGVVVLDGPVGDLQKSAVLSPSEEIDKQKNYVRIRSRTAFA